MYARHAWGHRPHTVRLCLPLCTFGRGRCFFIANQLLVRQCYGVESGPELTGIEFRHLGLISAPSDAYFGVPTPLERSSVYFVELSAPSLYSFLQRRFRHFLVFSLCCCFSISRYFYKVHFYVTVFVHT